MTFPLVSATIGLYGRTARVREETMNTKDLKCFQAVYEEKSVSRAARRLFITPQGLSKIIRQLEEELQASLFVRTARGMEATESGRFLYERSERVVRQLEEIENGLRQLEQRGERLRIGCANGALNLLPLEVILEFGEAHPELRLEWREYPNEQVKTKLLNSEIEYGFVIGEWGEGAARVRKITGCRICLLVYQGHPLYGQEQVNLRQLEGEPLLLMNESFHLYHDFMSLCAVQGVRPNVVAKTADGAGLYRLCSRKVGLAVAPEFFREEFSMDGVRALPFEEGLRWEVYGACMRETESYENIRMFDRYLRGRL